MERSSTAIWRRIKFVLATALEMRLMFLNKPANLENRIQALQAKEH